jgi:type 1 glutamine amidotransferase
MRRTKFVTLLVLALVAVPLVVSAGAPPKLKVLIVTGHDVKVHDWRKTTPCERATLEASGRFEVKVCEDTGIFESSTLNQYDAIVLNYGFWNVPELTPAARNGLLNFVSGGKGLVSLHFSSSSFQEWDEYKELLGRVWVKGVSGHGPRHSFTVKVEKPTHPIMQGIEDFTVNDELYAKLQGTAAIEVLASTHSPFSKQVEPMIFVKTYGKGRVVRNVLGHDVQVRSHVAYKKILCRSVEWAATGEVTLK